MLSFLLLLLPCLVAAEPVEQYPADPFSVPLKHHWSAFETLSGVQPAGNTVQRAEQYDVNELRSVNTESGRKAFWQFELKNPGGAVLCFHDRIRRMPDKVTVKVTNKSAVAATFAVSMGEIPWRNDKSLEVLNWAIEGDAPVEPGEEQTLFFDLTKLVPSPASTTGRAMPEFPTTINLHVGDTVAQTLYAFELSDFTVYYPSAEGVEVNTLDLPPVITPGENISIKIQAQGITSGKQVEVEFRSLERVLWRVRLTPEQVQTLIEKNQLDLTCKTPWYLPGRELTVGLVVDRFRASGVEAKTSVQNMLTNDFPRTERQMHNGRPTVYVNGKPLNWSGYASYEYQPGNISDFGAAGANLFVVPVAAGRHIHQIVDQTWLGQEQYDFSDLEEDVCTSLQANPDAFICLRVSLGMPVWWLQQHPESIVKIRTAGGDIAWEETGCLATSMASEDWYVQQEECLRALIAYCKTQPWASRIVAFMPTGEVTEEWFAWGSNDGQYGDYSPVSQVDFKRWCEERGLPWTQIPEPEAQQKPGWDYYPPDDAGRQSLAYAAYSSQLSANVITRFARVIKDATAGKALCGTFYGYVIQLAGEPRQHLAGQFALREYLNSPDIDFIAGIPLHNFRSLTSGYDLYTSATESILAAGKFIVNENDLFSWLHHFIWNTPYDPADPRGGAIKMHRRVLANDMVHGSQRQWFSLLSSWHHDAGLLEEFSKQIKLQSTGFEYDRTGVEEIAFVVDDTSFAAMPPESALPRQLNVGLLYALGRTGAPVGIWMLRDLDKLPERIKMVVVTEATAARSEDLVKLRDLLAKGGRTVVIVGAPGLINPVTGEWDLNAPAEITGLPLRVNPDGGPDLARLVDTGEGISGIEKLRPRTTGAGQGWLSFSDGQTAGLERDLPAGGKLIWSSTPPQNNHLTRRWIEQAKVHIYAPLEFTVHASKELVAITASQAGEVTLSWPENVKIQDLLDGWQGEGKEIACLFDMGQTRLFRVLK